MAQSGPPVVAFYSFKGGVGRTTTLANIGYLKYLPTGYLLEIQVRAADVTPLRRPTVLDALAYDAFRPVLSKRPWTSWGRTRDLADPNNPDGGVPEAVTRAQRVTCTIIPRGDFVG